MIFHGSVMAEIMRLHAEIERLEAELAAFKQLRSEVAKEIATNPSNVKKRGIPVP
jgi:uncharacterized protein (UPF0335 family)